MTRDERLEQAIVACKAGRRAEAQSLLRQVLVEDPTSEKAWLWLSAAVDTDQERRACLVSVLRLNPASDMAQRGLAHLDAKGRSTAPVKMPQPGQTAIPPTSLEEVTREVEPALIVERPPERRPSQPAATDEKRGISRSTLRLAAIGTGTVFVFVVGFLASQALGPGHQSATGRSQESYAEITSVVYENVAAHNAEDVDRYIATMHTESPNYANLRQVMADAYAAYDLHAELSGVEVVKLDRNEAHVSFVLVTTKLRGPEFRDNRTEGIFVLRLQDGRWKLYDRKVEEIEYLD